MKPPTRCTECDSRGWLHMRSSDLGEPDHVERCDICKTYPDDESAAEAHARDCGCGLTVESDALTGCWHYDYQQFCTQCDPASYGPCEPSCPYHHEHR